MPEKALRLYPLPPIELHPAEIHKNLPIILPNKSADGSLPNVSINMVGSVDGKAAAADKASGIGSSVDRQVMRNLRAGNDAVAVGANTLRAERLSLGLDKTPAHGHQPLAVVVTGTGEVPLRENLITHDGQRVILVCTDDTAGVLGRRLRGRADLLPVPADRDGYPDLECAFRALRRGYGVKRLLVEGGPGVNRALVSKGLVDELFLTLAPRLLGAGPNGVTKTILEGELQSPVNLRLVSVHLALDELFLRYARANMPDGSSRGANFA